ncbi:MAG: FGGY-family carbohydrate kinase [Actinomycetales bacterium]
MTALTIGIDLATASARCVALDTATGKVVARADSALSSPERPASGVSLQTATYAPTALELVRQVCERLGPDAARVAAVSVTGTSGTVVPVDRDGAAVGAARMYDDTSGSDVLAAANVTGASSLGRMVAIRRELPAARWASTPDVVNAALAGHAVAADTSHWLKAGIDLTTRSWPVDAMTALGLDPADNRRLPELVLPGTRIGTVDREVARTLGLPENVHIVAGMTDGCTAQLAAGAVHDGDTMGVLGTTLVLKAVSESPIESADGAVYSHLAPDGRYWAGGASNSGAGVLATEFAGHDLAAMDQQVANNLAGHVRYPISVAGERFPVADRHLPPLSDGEPLNRLDAYRAVLEGVAFIERLGLERLQQLGVTPRRHVIAGGATASPVWNRIRATVLAPLAPVSVARSASSGVGASILAAYALTDAPLTDVVDRLVSHPVPVEAVAAQQSSLDDSYRRFVDLVEGSLPHV